MHIGTWGKSNKVQWESPGIAEKVDFKQQHTFKVVTLRVRSKTIHFKLENVQRGISPTLHLAKEGDLMRNNSGTSTLSSNI